MSENLFVNYNGSVFYKKQLLIPFDTHSLKYGAGFFTTALAVNKNIFLYAYHWQRIITSFKILELPLPKNISEENIKLWISELLDKNQHQYYAKVRIAFFINDINSYSSPDVIIETFPLQKVPIDFNTAGLSLGVYDGFKKNYDQFAALKSNNYVGYLMAARYAKQQGFNDALILNSRDHVIETSVANIFIVTENEIFTPPLTEGCVEGVMRKYLLERFEKDSITILEKQIVLQDLAAATEIFLTNALRGIEWVKEFEGNTYTNGFSGGLYKKYILPFIAAMRNDVQVSDTRNDE